MSRTQARNRQDSADSAGARSKPRGEHSSGQRVSPGREILLITGSILSIICGLVFAAIGFGGWYASREAVDILREISSRDVSGPHEQVTGYEKFFKGLDQKQFIVRRDEPRNLQNVITYLWTVEHRESGEVTQFRWEWDMSTLNVVPRSNGALLLDRRLKNIADSEMNEYDFYDPDDEFALAIVQQDVSIIEEDAEEVGPAWSDEVLPPLLSPENALKRKGSYEEEKQKEQDEQAGSEAGAGDSEEKSPEDEIVPEVHLPDHHPANPPVRDDM